MLDKHGYFLKRFPIRALLSLPVYFRRHRTILWQQTSRINMQTCFALVEGGRDIGLIVHVPSQPEREVLVSWVWTLFWVWFFCLSFRASNPPPCTTRGSFATSSPAVFSGSGVSSHFIINTISYWLLTNNI